MRIDSFEIPCYEVQRTTKQKKRATKGNGEVHWINAVKDSSWRDCSQILRRYKQYSWIGYDTAVEQLQRSANAKQPQDGLKLLF